MVWCSAVLSSVFCECQYPECLVVSIVSHLEEQVVEKDGSAWYICVCSIAH
jgi:hypothetical protein